MELTDLERMHGLLERLAREYRGYLPHEGTSGEFCSANQALSSDTRTRLALIEDTLRKGDQIVGDCRCQRQTK